MGKTIKLEPKTYDRLESFRTKSETFSQAVERLLDIASFLKMASDRMGISPPPAPPAPPAPGPG